MKKVYFIRHGESEGNVGHIRQEGLEPFLTDNGKKQATFIATRCSKFPIEIIISSIMNRAKETAQIIASEIKIPLELSNLFIERRRPKEQNNKPKDDPEAIRADQEIIKNFANHGYRFSDEENFDDLKNRARRALMFLENRREENILVVTHDFFIRVIVAIAVFEEKLTGYECKEFIRAFRMENTGITTLCFYNEKDNAQWRLLVWNDHTHLL